jgi:hypothetical protein
LPSVVDLALGKHDVFAECQTVGTRQNGILKMQKIFFCRVSSVQHTANIFLIKKLNLCRVPSRLALGKAAVNVSSAVMPTFFAEGRKAHSKGFAECPIKSTQ